MVYLMTEKNKVNPSSRSEADYVGFGRLLRLSRGCKGLSVECRSHETSSSRTTACEAEKPLPCGKNSTEVSRCSRSLERKLIASAGMELYRDSV
jgi:hypothetical protein